MDSRRQRAYRLNTTYVYGWTVDAIEEAPAGRLISEQGSFISLGQMKLLIFRRCLEATVREVMKLRKILAQNWRGMIFRKD
jgi:hypothetical protein